MISTKQFLNVNGVTKRFLVDFPIASDHHARVFVHSLAQPTINDFVSTNTYDMIDNSIVFYTAPTQGSIVTIEVATSPEEFGSAVSLPAADIATNAALAAEASALAALGYKNQAGVYASQSISSAAAAALSATQADSFRALAALSATDASIYAAQALAHRTGAELAQSRTEALELSFTNTATGAIAIANGANTKSNTALANSESAINGANFAIFTANGANQLSSNAVLTANNALTVANGAALEASTANSTANQALSNSVLAEAKSNTAILTANEALLASTGAIKTYATDTPPTVGVTQGDLNFKPAEGNKTYRHDGVAWQPVRDTGIASAQTAADNAQTTANSAGSLANTANIKANDAYTLAALNVSKFMGFDPAVSPNGFMYLDSSASPYIPRLKYWNSGAAKNVSSNISYGEFNFATDANFTYYGGLSTTGSGFELFGGAPGSFNGIRIDSPSLFPTSGGSSPKDNLTTLGRADARWSVVFAGSGTINTSDERTKEQILQLTAQEKAVAVKLKNAIKTFKFKDAVLEKGTNARIHVGVIAQEVKAIFESEGLIAEKYSILCYDEWETLPEILQETNEDGIIIKEYVPARPAGNRYGIRYEELLAFIISAM